MKELYQTPYMMLLSVKNEGILCTSQEEEESELILPGTTWKDETIW